MEYEAQTWGISMKTKDRKKINTFSRETKSKLSSKSMHPPPFRIAPQQMFHRPFRLNITNNGFIFLTRKPISPLVWMAAPCLSEMWEVSYLFHLPWSTPRWVTYCCSFKFLNIVHSFIFPHLIPTAGPSTYIFSIFYLDYYSSPLTGLPDSNLSICHLIPNTEPT